MKILLLLLSLALSANIVYGQDSDANSKTEIEIVKGKVLRHVVIFQWNEGTSDEKVTEIEQAFAGLQSKIPQIMDFEWGTNNSPEGLDKGFTHCFFVTFQSEKDRETYLPHPDHQAFVKLIGDHVKDVLVIDYWTE